MKLKQIIKNNYHYFVFFAFIFFTIIICINKKLYYLDDYYYYTVAKSDISNFIPFLKWHYLNQNGRILVHILDLLALRYNGVPWIFINPASIGLIIFFVAKTFTNDYFDFKKSLVISTLVFGCIDFEICRSAIYWISASFNYVIPAAMFSVILFLTIKKKYTFSLCVLSFVAGTTMEQFSMIIIGFYILLILSVIFIEKSKPDKCLYISLLFSVLGFLTNALAPASSKRIFAGSSEITSRSYLDIFYNEFIFTYWFNPVSIIFVSIFSLSVILLLFKIQSLKTKGKFGIYSLIAIIDIVILIANCAFKLPLFNSGFLASAIIIIYVIMISFSCLLVCIQLIIQKRSYLPAIMLVLALGAQFMTLVLKVYSLRTMFPSVICFFVIVVYSFSVSYELLKPIVKTFFITVFSIFLIFNTVKLYKFFNSENGYYINYPKNFYSTDEMIEYIETHDWYSEDPVVLSWFSKN